MARHLQSQSFTRKKRLKKWWGIISLIIIVIAIVYASSWLLRAKFLTIEDVTIFGADSEISSQIHDIAVSRLEGNYMKLFPRSNVLLYPKTDIDNIITKTFPRVQNIEISRDGFTRLRITVNEKTPIAVVCATLPNFNNNILVYDVTDPCYFSDSTGLLFEHSSTLSDHQYHLYYTPDISLIGSTTDYTGAYATSTPEFALLESFYNGAVGDGIGVDGMLLKQNGEFEMYASSTVIYFNDTKGIQDELLNLIAFWNHMIKTNTTNKKPLVFDYIDLRYGSNVFYKVLSQ